MNATINYDVYLIGVGGQGIGLLSEALIRAIDVAGFPVRGVDTHGLAQRGGTVTSHVRVGNRAHSPLIRPGAADVVIALERHEALRGMCSHLKDGGTIVYYDCEWQPLPVRLGKVKRLNPELIVQESKCRKINLVRVFEESLSDPRMQNVAVISALIKNKVLPGITLKHFEAALKDLMSGDSLAQNLELVKRLSAA